jgi:phosphate starvation-inducible membrane PsiE
MRVRNLSELKFLIWEAILAALVVASVESFVVAGHELTWEALILPLGILILALGLFLARRAQAH